MTLTVSNPGLCPWARYFIMLASSVDRDVNVGSRRPKLTLSVISDVKPIIDIYILHFNARHPRLSNPIHWENEACRTVSGGQEHISVIDISHCDKQIRLFSGRFRYHFIIVLLKESSQSSFDKFISPKALALTGALRSHTNNHQRTKRLDNSPRHFILSLTFSS